MTVWGDVADAVVFALLLVAVLVLAAGAVGRCRAEVAALRAAARRRAEVALVVERHRIEWDADTALLATALDPLLSVPDAARPVGGFGDAVVLAERVATAMRTIAPPAEEIPW